jgi:heptosyltransferase I
VSFTAAQARFTEGRSGAPTQVWVVKPSSLGDVIHTLPAVALLQRRWPESVVRWIVNTEWSPVLTGAPGLAEVICFPRRDCRGLLGLGKAARWAANLRTGRPRADVVLDFQGLLRSALISKAVGARWKLGLADAREGAGFFYDAAVPTHGHVHAIDRYLALVQALGVPEVRRDEVLALDVLPEGDPLRAELAGTGDGTGAVVIHPFSRGVGKSIRWADVVALAEGLAPVPVIIVGMTPEPAPALPGHVTSWVNRTSLRELITVFRRALGVISVDSGPMHLAAALRKPLIGIHSWSDPRQVGPYDSATLVWKGGTLGPVAEVSAALAQVSRLPGRAEFREISAAARRWRADA